MNLNIALRNTVTGIADIIVPVTCYQQRQIFRQLFLLLVCFSISMVAVQAQAEEPSANVEKSREYKIGPEDVLQISVWKEPELQREVLVRPDGGITFPLAGDVMAAGKTPAELQSEIKLRIQKYIPDAVVTVSVTKLTGFRVYVIGKVKKPGQFVIGRYVDVLQALTLAGGLDPYASQKKIKVLRKKNGKEIVFPFNYKAVKNGENLEQNISLQNDDVVVVP
jgi:polysaccharide export outer membrane protein